MNASEKLMRRIYEREYEPYRDGTRYFANRDGSPRDTKDVIRERVARRCGVSADRVREVAA